MSVERQSFGFMPDGTEIFKYIITNSSECSANVLTLGATLQALFVKDKDGGLRDVTLGFDTVEDYLTRSDYQGATVGPYCNRISPAELTINGTSYPLTVNERGITCLHAAGECNLAGWKAIVVDADCVEFSYLSPDGQNGFPGNKEITVQYRLTEDDRLQIRYKATADKDTYLNFTNHSYFNLNGYAAGSILSHSMTLFADEYTPVDANSIPTGGNLPVAGTPFDFTSAHSIGERIEAEHEQLRFTGGYDHNFCVRGEPGALRPAAEVLSKESGIVMRVETTLPGIQFYAGNFLSGIPGKAGVPMDKRTGFCLETQYYPDTPHRPEFPSCLFKAGEAYESETVYAFSVAEE